jgi:6-phosphogluconolactonase
MKTKVWKATVTFPVIFVLALGIASCGGGADGPGGGPSGPSAGEYLWEFSDTDQGLYFASVNSGTGQLGVPTASGGDACNSEGTIPALAVAPSNKYAFVIDNCASLINTYVINGPSISLTIAHKPLSGLGDLESVAIDPMGRYLYVIATGPGALYQLGIDSGSGELTLLSTVMESADIRVVVADPTGKFIYASDETGGQILAYLVNGGSLSPISGSPFTVPSSGQPIYLAMQSSGKFLYAPLLSGGIAGFSIDRSTGALSDIQGSPFDTGNLPFTLASDPLGRFLYAIDTNLSSVEGFKIDATTGALTLIVGSPLNLASPVNSLAVDPSGSFLYATVNATNLGSSMILGFTIDGSSGSITALATSPYLAPSFPTNVVSLNVP